MIRVAQGDPEWEKVHHDELQYKGPVRVPCPSIEEMLERLPKYICQSASDPILYLAIHYTESGLSFVGYRGGKGEGYMFHLEDSPTESLAFLCIWLHANNLMKWG